MRYFTKLLSAILVVVTITLIGTGSGYAQLKRRQPAPAFSLSDINGKPYELAAIKTKPLIILYFFDVDSLPSQEGLLSLDQLAKKYTNTDLLVWGITRSTGEKVQEFVSRTQVRFPILLDRIDVSDAYHARLILPTVCILGPQLKVLDYIQGGGKSTEIMMVRLAQRNIQRRQFMLAKALSEEAAKENPENLEARRDKGWAEVLQGDLAAAEKTFLKLSGSKGRGEILGKEGLAKVYAQKGQPEKALKYVEEVEKKAPDSVVAHVIKGDYYASKDDIKQAKTEYQKAAQKKEGPAFQKAVAVNKLGRIQAKAGNLKQARKHYNQAVEIDPYYIEATSNKGMTYEKEGKWDKALDAYRQALLINQKDIYASVLAGRAQERLAIENDARKKMRMDTLVKNLAQRYRERKKTAIAEEDQWTSRPMILTFVDFQEKGGLAERDGFATVLTSQLSSEINASGRAQAVERIIVERLIEELNIGTSEFANPETSLRLGRVLAAKIIGTGLFYHLPSGTLLSLRLIDTETTKIPKVITRQFMPGVSLEKEIHALNREILKSIIAKYPLRGYVIQRSNGRIMINLGQKQGVVLGTRFEVLKDQEPVEYKGKKLERKPISIARVEIVEVEPELCYAKVINKKSPVSPDDKVEESIANIQ